MDVFGILFVFGHSETKRTLKQKNETIKKEIRNQNQITFCVVFLESQGDCLLLNMFYHFIYSQYFLINWYFPKSFLRSKMFS